MEDTEKLYQEIEDLKNQINNISFNLSTLLSRLRLDKRKNLTNRLLFLKQLIPKIGISTNDLKQKTKDNLTLHEFDETISILIRRGKIYEPSQGFFKST